MTEIVSKIDLVLTLRKLELRAVDPSFYTSCTALRETSNVRKMRVDIAVSDRIGELIDEGRARTDDEVIESAEGMMGLRGEELVEAINGYERNLRASLVL